MKEYPITSYTTIFTIGKLHLMEVKNYRYRVMANVRPRDYPKEVGSIKYKLEWR